MELQSIANIIKEGGNPEEEEEEMEGGKVDEYTKKYTKWKKREWRRQSEKRERERLRIRYPDLYHFRYPYGEFSEGGGLQEDEYEKMNRRRNRLLDVVRDYRSETELLRDIEWTKAAHVF